MFFLIVAVSAGLIALFSFGVWAARQFCPASCLDRLPFVSGANLEGPQAYHTVCLDDEDLEAFLDRPYD